MPADKPTWTDAVTLKITSNFTGMISLTNSLTFKLKVDTISTLVYDYEDSHIGKINMQVLNLLTKVIENVLKIGVNAVFGRGFDLTKIFKFLQPLTVTDIQIVLNDDYLAIIGVPKVENIEDLLILDFENGVEDLTDLSQIWAAVTPEEGFLGETLKSTLKEAYDSSTPEETRQYLSHSSMKGVKTAYKTIKFFESAFNMANPDHMPDTSLDEL